MTSGRAEQPEREPSVVTPESELHFLRNETGRLYRENERLRWALREARDELARWGWGDMHYGSQGQEKRVTDALAKIDGVVA